MFPLLGIVGKNGIFWILFALMGALIALRVPFLEIVLGVIVIFLGLSKLGNDLQERKNQEGRESLQQTLQDIQKWLEREYRRLQRMEMRYENRFFQSDKKRIAMERKTEKNYRELVRTTDRKIEKNYRELVKKMLQLENKMNEVSRAFLTSKPRSGGK